MILIEINTLISHVAEGFDGVANSYNKIVADIQNMETNKANIMKLPGMPPQQRLALLQQHTANTEKLKQIAMYKQNQLANYGNELVNKYSKNLKETKP